MRISVHTLAEATSRLSFDLKRGTASTVSYKRAGDGQRKCEGATGSLATLTSGRSPSLPRSIHHGSRLPAMSRGELQVGTLSGLLAVLPHLARSIWAGRGLKLSGDVFWAGAARRMRASRRLPCPRDPLRRARLAVAPAALAKAPAVRACHSWSRAAACAPQLLGIEPVRDVAAAYPMLRLIAVRVVIVRVVVRMAVHIHPLVRRGSCLG